MDWWGLRGPSGSSPYIVLLNDLFLIPIWHYLFAFLAISFAFLYHFLEFHFLQDLFTGFRGCPVALTYNSSSHIYHGVVSKCRILHSRYLVTPWLSSPHVQTVFLGIFGRPPVFKYRRELFHLSDGGTIALDWLMNSDEAWRKNGMFPRMVNQRRKRKLIEVGCGKGLIVETAAVFFYRLELYSRVLGWGLRVLIGIHSAVWKLDCWRGSLMKRTSPRALIDLLAVFSKQLGCCEREVFSETISWHQKRLTFILHAIIQDSWRSCNDARKPCEKVLVGGTEEGKTEHFSSGMGMIA